MSRSTPVSSLVASSLAVAGMSISCGAPLPPPGELWEAVIEVPPERPICGWEEVTTKTATMRISEEGDTQAAPGQSVVVIAPKAGTSYGAVQLALEPAQESLVRVKVAFEQRWLLSTTYPQKKRQPPKPPIEHRATRIVGHRQITRDVRRPAERMAALRIDGERVVVFVENERQGGDDMSVSSLAGALAALEPKARVFALAATADTPWATVQKVALTAACYDRKPGDEPHEIILD
jgi:hypothetical protein